MKKYSIIPKISLVTALILIFSSLYPLSSMANFNGDDAIQNSGVLDDVLATEQVDGINIDVELDEYILSDEFDLEAAVANTPSIQTMTDEQKDIFDQIVKEQVALSGIEDEEELKLFEEALVDFFDETSDTYSNLMTAQEDLESELEVIQVEEVKEESFATGILIDTFGIRSADASIINVKGKIKVGVNFAGAAFNTAIGVAVGGGVGAIQAFIIKKGKKEAERLFTRTVTSRLKAWGATKLAGVVGLSVITALNYLDIGNQIAKQIDRRDSIPNNGWINIY